MAYTYSLGAGTEESPYEIHKLEDLDGIRYHLDKHFILRADLDFNEDSSYFSAATNKVAWTTGTGFLPIGDAANPFAGVFNGNGKTINNLFFDIPLYYKGLFGYSVGATVKNLLLLNVDVRANASIAGLCGIFLDGVLQNCGVTGEVKMWGTQAQVCQGAGGLVASLGNSTMTDCFSHASVTLTPISHPWAGYAGGLAGHFTSCTVTNCYSTGAVVNPSNYITAGMVPYVVTTSIVSCYWDIQTSLYTTSLGGIGKTTAQMKQEATFVDWDFTNIWDITEGVEYPSLTMEFAEPQPAGPTAVSSAGKLLVQGDLVIGV